MVHKYNEIKDSFTVTINAIDADKMRVRCRGTMTPTEYIRSLILTDLGRDAGETELESVRIRRKMSKMAEKYERSEEKLTDRVFKLNQQLIRARELA